jgi:hypothetical protein
MPLHVFRRALKVAKVTHNEAKRYRYRLVKSPEETILKLYRSEATAEFVGICLGDGHLNRYYLAIFGDKSKDTTYLLRHVKPLTRTVLKLTPKFKTNRPDENFLVINSAAGMRALHTLGLPYGDKIVNHARIPEWIFRCDSLMQACLKGLFDTDGCVYGFKRLPLVGEILSLGELVSRH